MLIAHQKIGPDKPDPLVWYLHVISLDRASGRFSFLRSSPLIGDADLVEAS
jgi:hypothetical protein